MLDLASDWLVLGQVMLDMEQEEVLVRERIARRKKEEERLREYAQHFHTYLFGPDGTRKSFWVSSF